jgi:threonine dehydratase
MINFNKNFNLNSPKYLSEEVNSANNRVDKTQKNLPSFEGICQAHSFIPEEVKNTPLIRLEGLSQLLDADVWIKNETVSPIASFKIRGAVTDLRRYHLRENAGGVVTSSSGNHGQGVAYAARLLNIPAHIFLPREANLLKRKAIELLGANIYEHGHDIDEAKDEAKRFATKNEFLFVDDGESLNVIEGAGTVGLEIAQSLKDIDAVFIPMGSGSLASGCAIAIKSLQPKVKVIAIQSHGAPAMVNSFHARKAISHPINTIADGLVCREPARLALETLLSSVDEAELVSDEELLAGISVLIERGHILVEPSGAASFAGAFKRRQEIKGKRIVLVLTGANIELNTLQKALNLSINSK